jgi:glycosyltransferase involved in cell wall biosynthesis
LSKPRPNTVLLDLTPLDTPSRYRGIGRYVRVLARGLAKLPAEQREGLELVGLTALDVFGRYRVTRDLSAFGGSDRVQRPTQADHYRVAYAKRLALWRAVRDLRPALVHLGDPNATPLLRSLTNTRWLATCHDLIAFHFPQQYFSALDGFGWAGRRIEHRRFSSADHVVAISDSTRQDLVSFLGIPQTKITRVYNGVDLEPWRAQATDGAERLERLGLRAKRFLIYAGDADWRKNVEGMVGGLAYARAHGADVSLVMAGVLSEARAQRVDQLAAERAMGPHVTRLGYVSDEDLAALFRKALAHLFVSRAEGFGLTVVEAMAAGCPVITTRAGSLAEVAGEAGLLVDPEDHVQIGEAILRLDRDQDLRNQQIRDGLRQAECFDDRAQARAMVRLYRSLIDNAPAS